MKESPEHRTTVAVPEHIIKEIHEKGYTVSGVLQRGWELVKEADGLNLKKNLENLKKMQNELNGDLDKLAVRVGKK